MRVATFQAADPSTGMRRAAGRLLAAACVGLAAACGNVLPATAAEHADWTWLRKEGTAALVTKPAPLAGVTRWTLESPRHRGAIVAMDVAPDGKRVATGGDDGVVRIWNLETGGLDRAFIGHRYGIYLVAWSPEGSLLATHAGADSTTRVWDVEAGRERKQFADLGWLNGLAWSRDGRKLAASTGGSGKIYVTEGLATPRLLTETGRPVLAMQWSPDGGRLAVAADGMPVSLLDGGNGKLVRSLDDSETGAATCLEWSVDGAILAVGSRAAVTLWEPDGSRLRARIATPANGLAWSPDGRRMAVSTGGKTLVLAAEAADKPQPLQRLAVPASRIDWNAGTDRIIGVSADRIEVVTADGTAVRSIDAGAAAAPLSVPGRPIVTGIGTPGLAVWDAKSFARLASLAGHASPVAAAAWTPDGSRLASGDATGSLRIWNVDDATSVTCQAHKGGITSLSWSPDGERLASLARNDKTAKLWNPKAEAVGTLEGHAGPVLSLAWSPAGKLLATGGADEQVLVWETEPVERGRAVEFTQPVKALAWSATKSAPAVAAVLGDGVIEVFNPATGKTLASLEDVRREGMVGDAFAAWPPGARPALLTGRNLLVQAWDLARGKATERDMAPAGGVGAGFAAGGAVVMVRCNDRTVRFHAAKPSHWSGALLDEGGAPVAIGPTGEIRHAADARPGLVAIVETADGQRTLTLDEFAERHGWKPGGKDIKLPLKE
jgi:WD40 repeat protein